ncbi:MAG TPA: metallophosphoesterase [Terriglobales bacterium]|nr:metallophosphoesterase [Terriglobales bacterium]
MRRTALPILILASAILCCPFSILAISSAARLYRSEGSAQASVAGTSSTTSLDVRLPLESRSVRFAVIGDSGSGTSAQYDIAKEMETYWQQVKYDFVIMLGDNIYGGHRPQDFVKKFELPYKPLLDAGVKFYASLGNHDDPNDERLYKPFNMKGERYYTFRKGPVEFFVLDSNYMDPDQLRWVREALEASDAKWKICYFHHPLYSAGVHHGADLDLRSQLLPLFQRYSVNVVFSGHEHVYQRIKPKDNIHYFVLGNSGKLMTHDFGSNSDLDAAFDTDEAFMIVEIAGDKLYFQTISRAGRTIDSGEIQR